MSVCSSSVSCLRIFAGEPSTSEPGGILVPIVTSAFAPMMERAPTSTSSRMIATHADEYFIVDCACVNNRGVADCDQFADDSWITGVNVDDSVVLNVRARPDDDAVDITAQDRAVPDARFFFKNYIA